MFSLSFASNKSFQNKFNFIRDIIVILGIVATVFSIFYAAQSASYAGAQAKYLAQQTADQRKVSSADFVDKITQELSGNRYVAFINAIEGDSTTDTSTYPILQSSGGQFTDSDIDDYVSKLDTVGE